MLKQFGALPTEERARNMKGRDYLWCLTNLLLDREEELERLCPSCRARAAGALPGVWENDRPDGGSGQPGL